MQRLIAITLAALMVLAGVLAPVTAGAAHVGPHVAVDAPMAEDHAAGRHGHAAMSSPANSSDCAHGGPAHARAAHGCCVGAAPAILGDRAAFSQAHGAQVARFAAPAADISEPIFGIFKPPRG